MERADKRREDTALGGTNIRSGKLNVLNDNEVDKDVDEEEELDEVVDYKRIRATPSFF